MKYLKEYVDKLLRDIPTMEDAAFRGVFLEVMTEFVDAFWGAP